MNKIIILTLLLSFFSISLNLNQKQIKPNIIIIDDKLNEQNVTLYMKEKNVKYLNLTLAQAKHESGNFTSMLCKTNNNIFGMRKAEIRTTTAIGSENHYAVYKSWKESIDDFILFQNFILNKVKTKQGYFYFITHKYAADKNYSKKLRKYL